MSQRQQHATCRVARPTTLTRARARATCTYYLDYTMMLLPLFPLYPEIARTGYYVTLAHATRISGARPLKRLVLGAWTHVREVSERPLARLRSKSTRCTICGNARHPVRLEICKAALSMINTARGITTGLPAARNLLFFSLFSQILCSPRTDVRRRKADDGLHSGRRRVSSWRSPEGSEAR